MTYTVSSGALNSTPTPTIDAYVNSGVELFIVLLNVKIVVEHCNTFSAVLTLSVSVRN